MMKGFAAVAVGVLVIAIAGCGSESTEPTAAPSTTPSEPGLVQGKFDVGGHELYLHCIGVGTPTVIYLHGSIGEPKFIPHASGAGFQELLAPDYRTCVYDRRNVGYSDTVDAPQLPEDALMDLHNLLAAADLAPPYVFVGASFGGILSYLYANNYPDEVVGMVLLDAMFPDELALEHLFPPAERIEAFSEDDEANGLERISHFKVLSAAQPFIANEPAIPVTYLASTQEGYEDNHYGIPEYDQRILELQAAYVDRFAPGILLQVDAPHFMEPVVPEVIADAVRDVIRAASAR